MPDLIESDPLERAPQPERAGKRQAAGPEAAEVEPRAGKDPEPDDAIGDER